MNLKRLLQHLLLCFIVSLGSYNCVAQGNWTLKAALPAAANARDGAVSFTVNNIAYTGTGHYSNTYFDATLNMNVTTEESLVDFWQYDGTTWTQVADISSGTTTITGAATTPAHARDQAFAFSVSTKGYVGGGHWLDNVNYIHYELKDLWEYNTATNVWKRGADIPTTVAGKAEAVGFSLGTKGYAGMGYYHDNAVPQTLVETRDLWEYNVTNNTWIQKTNFPGSYRYAAVGVGVNNKGYVGLGVSGSTFYSDWYQFDPTNGVWTARAAFPGAARKGAIGVTMCDKALVTTGFTSSGITNTSYEYDQVNNTWATVANFTGGACQEASGFSLFGKAYLVTGSFATALSKNLFQYTSANACNCNLVAPAGTDQSACGLTTAQIGGTALTGYTYSWSPSSGLSAANVSNPVASPSVTTSYIMWVTGTTGAGCYQNDTVVVSVGTPPTANAGTDKNICIGSSIAIGATAASGVSYSWSPSTGLSSSIVSNPTATPTTTTTYIVTATNNTTGCLKKDTVIVKVDAIPTANAGADQSVCLGNSTTIGATAVAGLNYSWSPATNLSSATVSNPTVTPTTSTITTYILTVTGSQGGCPRKDTVKVTSTAKPVANAGTDKTLCTGVCAALGITAVAGVSYSWTPAAGLSSTIISNPSACPTATTNYILTATNTTTGCFKIDTVKVTVNPIPVANAGVNKVSCSGVGVALGTTPVAGVTYAWLPTTGLSSTTASNPTLTLTTANTYTYILTASSLGCTKKDTVSVTINANPTVSAGTDKNLCSGNCVTIGMTAVAGISYSWSPSTNLSSATVSNPSACPTSLKTYILTATNPTTGCFRKDTIVVNVNAKPVANAGLNKVVCKGSPVTIGSGSVSGINYVWSPATTLSSGTISNPIATPTATTSYIVTATNPTTACFKKDTVVVTVNALPTVSAGVDKVICAGTSVTLGATGVAANTYTWSPITSLSSPYVSNPVSTTTSTRTYIVTGKVTATGCTKKDTVVVTVNPTPTANAGTDRTICSGVCSTLGTTAVAGVTYTWTPTTALSNIYISNPSACPTTTTSYILTAKNSTSLCTRKDTVKVTVNTTPAATAGVDKTLCASSSTTIGATALSGVNYAWTPTTGLSSSVVSNPTASPTATTSYIMTATSSNGCVKKDTVKVVVSAYPAANAGLDKTITAGSSVVIGTAGTSGFLYAWTPTTALSPSAAVAQPIASPLVTTTYILTVTNALSGCSKKDTMKVVVTASPIGRYANSNNELITDLGQVFKIYPNPAHDVLSLSSDIALEGDWNIEIANMLGQVVASEKVNLNQEVLSFELPVSELAKGVYLITIHSDKGAFSAKMVKE